MNTDSKIYIAGHTGLAGSAIHRNLLSKGYTNFVLKSHSRLDLLSENETDNFFSENKPEIVFLAAAKVGGILANNKYRAQFIFKNLQIQNNIIHKAYSHGVKKLIFLGSSCIYPKNSMQPIKEDYLLTGELEYTNEPYAVAKIAGIKMCESYNIEYGTNFISVMPTNLYGYKDNFDLDSSHVLPALIRKMHLAKCLMNKNYGEIISDLKKNRLQKFPEPKSENETVGILAHYGIIPGKVILWGSGKPMREFLHADDLADACVFLAEKIDFNDIVSRNRHNISIQNKTLSDEIKNTHINIGTGKDISIYDLAYLIKKIVGFDGEISWDTSKPDGTFRKLLDVSKINSLGWKYSVELEDGIRKIYDDYTKAV